jgi:AcrR family transcriptional regulator
MATAPSSRLPAAERRRQLLDVSVQLFAERGFDGTSMADLAEAAGVTKPVLYQHFRSKRALYSELLEEVSHLLVNEVEKAAATAEGPHAQVRAGFAAYFRFVDQRRAAFQLLFLGDSRHDRVLTAAVDQLEAAMADAIAPLIEARIGPKHRRQLAMALIGMAEATGRRSVIDEDLVGPEGLDAMAGRLAELAWSGLRGIRPEVDPDPEGGEAR